MLSVRGRRVKRLKVRVCQSICLDTSLFRRFFPIKKTIWARKIFYKITLTNNNTYSIIRTKVRLYTSIQFEKIRERF